jgi:hypothetical protein
MAVGASSVDNTFDMFLHQQVMESTRSRIPVFSWSCELAHRGFMLVQAPLGEVKALRPVSYF